MKRLILATALLLPLVSALGGTAPARAHDHDRDETAADTAGQQNVLDVHRLPLGDGHVSDTPRRGYVMACRFGSGREGGALHDGGWIHGRTWDLTEKMQVQGRVMWPDAQFDLHDSDGNGPLRRLLTGNGLPVATPTGEFPVAVDDPAHRIDPNPNEIQTHNVSLSLPGDPKVAAEPSCVPMGTIGIALNGVAIFNALDDGGRDAVAHEVQDLCNGHPQMSGEYHYHGPSPCLPEETGNERLVGYALDGFGIYSMYDANGRELTNADLDECHGRVSTVEWNGEQVSIYHYVLTREYPYTVGCFRGTPVRVPHREGRRRFSRRGGPPGMGRMGGPPRRGPMGGPPGMGPMDGPPDGMRPPRRW